MYDERGSTTPPWPELVKMYIIHCRGQEHDCPPVLDVYSQALARSSGYRASIGDFRDTVWSFERDWNHKPAAVVEEEMVPARKRRQVNAFSSKAAQDLMSGVM